MPVNGSSRLNHGTSIAFPKVYVSSTERFVVQPVYAKTELKVREREEWLRRKGGEILMKKASKVCKAQARV